MVISRSRTALFFICWCLLATWLLYGGLELAEELKVIVKVQSSERDLDMEVLLQVASALKPDVLMLEDPLLLRATAEVAIEHSWLVPPHTRLPENQSSVQPLSSLRLHQYLSVYRI